MNENAVGRRARKSAPVKNAGNFAPMGKRRRFQDLGNQSTQWVDITCSALFNKSQITYYFNCAFRRWFSVWLISCRESTCDISLQSVDDNPQKHMCTRQRERLIKSEVRPRMSTPMGRDRSSLRRVRPRRSAMPRTGENTPTLPDLPNVSISCFPSNICVGQQSAI